MTALSPAAEKKLAQLRLDYKEAIKNLDGELVTIIKHQAASIKAGERFYLYDEVMDSLSKQAKSDQQTTNEIMDALR